jgi:hypothetical protein
VAIWGFGGFGWFDAGAGEGKGVWFLLIVFTAPFLTHQTIFTQLISVLAIVL